MSVFCSRMSERIAVTILLLLTGVQAKDSVTLSSDSLCAVVGSKVTIPCKYSSSGNRTEEGWIHNTEGKQHQILNNTDQRLHFKTEKNKCQLVIKHVKVSDSGVYTYRFKTSNSGWTSASSGVNVTVKDVPTDFKKMNCWSVSYEPQATCALTGSSVEISSYFTLPNSQTLNTSFWVIGQKSVDDLRNDTRYKGRVEYRQISQNNHSMIISHLEKSDEQTYCFRFHTNDAKSRFTGYPRVSLSVTDLKVHKSDAGLNCSTTCSLPNNPTYIWYKNGQPLSDQNKHSLSLLDGKVDAGSYSCAVRGHEDLGSPAVCVSSEQDQEFKHPNMMRGNSSGVKLSVTGLQVEVEPGSEELRLLCNTTCSLPNTTSYVWYRNGEVMSQCKSASCTVALVNGMANYRCAVEGHTSLISPPVGWPIPGDVGMNNMVKYFAAGAGGLLFLIFIAVILLRRRIKATSSARTQESVENESGRVMGETDSPAVHDNDSSTTCEPIDSAVHYASVHFTRPSADNSHLYSSVQKPKPLNQEENIVYASVNVHNPSDVR